MIESVLSDPEIISASRFIECHYKELENGFSKPELMKCEQLRFNSFKHRPFEAYKGVWPSQLAKAGFHFDPRTSETVCYWCNIRIPSSHWKKGTNPFIVHRTQSPACEYITGQCKKNIPFHTQSQRGNRLSYLEPNSSSTQRSFSQQGRLVTDHGGGSAPPTVQVTAPTVTQESNNLSIQPRARLSPSANRPAKAQSLPIGASRDSLLAEQPQRRQPPFHSLPVTANPGTLPDNSTSHQSRVFRERGNNHGQILKGHTLDLLQHMKSEEARLMSYTKWPNYAAVSPVDLARAGFFYTGSNDQVQCAFCENGLRNWEPGENPLFEHRRHFPKCGFISGKNVGNYPIPTEERIKAQVLNM